MRHLHTIALCVLWPAGLALAQAQPPAKSARPAAAKSDELAIDAKSDKALLALAGKGFKLKHTPHYVIAYDTDDKTLKAFVNRVEPTYKAVTRFAEQLGLETTTPSQKLEILFFNEFPAYESYSKKLGFPGSQNAPGFWTQSNNKSAFFNYGNSDVLKKLRNDAITAKEDGKRAVKSGAKVDFRPIRAAEGRVKQQEERINCTVVQHEVAHQVLFNIGFHAKSVQANPRWFVEGLAMMFETPPTGGSAGIGAVNQMRLGDWKSLKKKGALAEVDKVVTDPRLILPSNPNAAATYAQAWSLVHYLQRDRRKQFLEYVKSIRKREGDAVRSAGEELAAFEAAFGSLDSTLVSKYEAYLEKIDFKPLESGL